MDPATLALLVGAGITAYKAFRGSSGAPAAPKGDSYSQLIAAQQAQSQPNPLGVAAGQLSPPPAIAQQPMATPMLPRSPVGATVDTSDGMENSLERLRMLQNPGF